MPIPLLIILIPLFIVAFIACLKLYYYEKKILERLKEINQAKWEELIWWFGSRAHPFRFRKFINKSGIEDDRIKEYIQKYRQALHVQLIAIAIIGVLVMTILLFGSHHFLNK